MLSIKKYNEKYFNEWNDFTCNDSNNGTIFHNRIFLSYHIDRSFIDYSLLFYYHKKLIAVLPASLLSEKKKKVLHSHPGASYGGFVIKKNLEFNIIDLMLNALSQFCKRNKFDSIFLINPPQAYFESADESLDYLLLWHGFSQKEIYISHAVNLNAEINVTSLLKKRKKRYVKNSIEQMNIVFKDIYDFKDFYSLLSINKKKYHAKPTHSLKELLSLKNLLPDSIKLIVAINDNEIIGGTLLFLLNKKVSLVFYNIVDERFRTTQLSTFQLVNCMKLSKKLGLSIIDLGVSHTPELKNPFAPKKSLIQFKEQFGARGIIRTAYQLDLR